MIFFASDLHGSVERYRALFDAVLREQPAAVLLGGDLLPHGATAGHEGDFVRGFLEPEWQRLRRTLAPHPPRLLLILGNDDPRSFEPLLLEAAGRGTWDYLHNRRTQVGDCTVFGYSCVPPTPFLLKDWERYDISRYVDPGCVSPEEGHRTVAVPDHSAHDRTIRRDLEELAGTHELTDAIFLFHSPPYRCSLDRAALDGQMVEHVPVDVHVGSIAIARFIEERQPLLTLHGHVHEAARLTDAWRERFGRTHALTAAHDGPQLALVRFDPADLEGATRELL